MGGSDGIESPPIIYVFTMSATTDDREPTNGSDSQNHNHRVLGAIKAHK